MQDRLYGYGHFPSENTREIMLPKINILLETLIKNFNLHSFIPNLKIKQEPLYDISLLLLHQLNFRQQNIKFKRIVLQNNKAISFITRLANRKFLCWKRIEIYLGKEDFNKSINLDK